MRLIIRPPLVRHFCQVDTKQKSHCSAVALLFSILSYPIISSLRCRRCFVVPTGGKLGWHLDPEHFESVVQWLILPVHPDGEGRPLQRCKELPKLQQESMCLFQGNLLFYEHPLPGWSWKKRTPIRHLLNFVPEQAGQLRNKQ